jgi:hypothetical protein
MRRNFALRGRVILGSGSYRVHILEENITVPGTSFAAPPVLATNVYRRSRDHWSMVLHHASVAPAIAGAPVIEEPDAGDAGEAPRLH